MYYTDQSELSISGEDTAPGTEIMP